MQTIGANLIVLNEERYIATAIKSLLPLTNEIVIVDGGSIDDTVAICKQFTINLLTRKFDFDFASQRNLALENSKSDWILALDADEAITPDSIEPIKHLINNLPYEDASMFTICGLNYLDDRLMSTDYHYRLFRRDCSKWKDKLHESIELTNGKGYQAPEPIRIEHRKELRRQLYSDQLYKNIEEGNLTFPSDDDFNFTERTFEGI